MKHLLFSFIFSIFFCLPVGAQSLTSICPEIVIDGPAGITMTGTTALFSINNEFLTQNSSLEYKWTVENGELKDGNGTNRIEVIAPDSSNFEELKVSVVVNGINSICKNTAETIAPVVRVFHCVPSDEFELKDWEEVKGRIDLMLINLQNDPAIYALIRVNSPFETDSKRSNKLIKKIVTHIKFRDFDLERINFEVFKSNREYISWLRVPYTAEIPVCLDCRIVSGSSLK